MTPEKVLFLAQDHVEVQLWNPVAAGLDPQNLAVLDHTEKARAARFRSQADANRFVTGRLALRTALARRFGADAASLAIEIDANGRPFCSGGPHFSISHSGDYVLLAVSQEPTLAVGIDIEFADPRVDLARVSERVCTACERGWIEAGGGDRAARFFELWTCKEAALKARGIGLAIDPRAAIYVPGQGKVLFANHTGLAEIRVVVIDAPAGYHAALAFDQDD